MTLRDDYNRDGYVVVKCFLTPLWLPSEWQEDNLKAMLDHDVNKYISYLSIMAKNIEIQKYILEADLFYRIGIENAAIASQPVMHVMSPNLKIPGGYYGTEAHQDWPSVQGSLDMVTVWLPLTPAGIGNFPLEVIPGSHKQGLKEGKMKGSVLEVEAHEKEFIAIECGAGDIVLLNGFTIHRTGNGIGFRVAVSQRFDNVFEPTFIERGYPCAQKRVVDREIKWKPSIEQVQEIFK